MAAWTPRQEKALVDLYAQFKNRDQVPVNDLASLLRMRPADVKAKAKELGLDSTPRAQSVRPVRAKGGMRDDLGIFTRSSWEANCLRWFNYCEIEWRYEPRTFEFSNIKRGTRSYTPDIFLPQEEMWIEIKGYFSDKDGTRTKRFQKYYPDEASKLKVIVKNAGCQAAVRFEQLGVPVYAFYDDLKIAAALIPNWES